jgi:hypothetical protein
MDRVARIGPAIRIVQALDTHIEGLIAPLLELVLPAVVVRCALDATPSEASGGAGPIDAVAVLRAFRTNAAVADVLAARAHAEGARIADRTPTVLARRNAPRCDTLERTPKRRAIAARIARVARAAVAEPIASRFSDGVDGQLAFGRAITARIARVARTAVAEPVAARLSHGVDGRLASELGRGRLNPRVDRQPVVPDFRVAPCTGHDPSQRHNTHACHGAVTTIASASACAYPVG